jgi:hypothetical protein
MFIIISENVLLPSSQWKINMSMEKCSTDNRERDSQTRNLEETDQAKQNGKKWALGRGIFGRVERWERSGTEQLKGS